DDTKVWSPTTIIRGDNLVSDVSKLREQHGGDISIMGSASVVRALLSAGLVDELMLMIEPIVLGGGKSIFEPDGKAQAFDLISLQTANTGVQICRYEPKR